MTETIIVNECKSDCSTIDFNKKIRNLVIKRIVAAAVVTVACVVAVGVVGSLIEETEEAN